MSGPRMGSLCSGYGGLDMGVQAVLGGSLAWVSDIDKGACKILAHRHPAVPNLGDFTKTDWATVEPVDIVCAGFPCQPVSNAGKQLGDLDERWLWDDVARAVGELRPGLVVLENVRGLLSAGGGRLFGRVLGTLAALGYDAQWHGLRAADVGAPHGRWRVFIVAHPADDRLSRAGRPRARWAGLANDDRRLASAPVEGVVQFPVDGLAGGVLPGVDLDQLTDVVSGFGGQGDGSCGHASTEHRRGTADKKAESKSFQLLPTPAVNDMGEGKTVEAWDEWTAKMKAAHGNGNGHGASLAIEAQRLLPTPSAITPDSRRSTPDGATYSADGYVREQLGDLVAQASWGQYAEAIARWEALTRPAPPPTETGPKGSPRLSAAFSEWLMGLPAGWITDVPGITRSEALKAAGNGVVPQQAEAAVRFLLSVTEAAA